MQKVTPILIVIAAMLTGCQDATSPDTQAVAASGIDDSRREWTDAASNPCPLLGIPTTVRYEIQSGSERQYRVHLINTNEAPMAADCGDQQPLPGNVIMRYRLASRA